MSLAVPGLSFADPAEDGNAGLDALQQGDYPRAITLFTRAITSNGLSHDDLEFAYRQRGLAYLHEGNRTAAAMDFRQAVRLKPDDTEAKIALAEAQSRTAVRRATAPLPTRNPMQDAQAGLDALNGGDPDQAIILLSRALNSGRLSPDAKELALLSRGRAYSKRGEFGMAATDLNLALQLKPTDADAVQAFSQALSNMKPPKPVAPIEKQICLHNLTTSGSVMAGKTYTSYAEYADLAPIDAFAGVFNAVGLYSPVPAEKWDITGADLTTGAITGVISFGGSVRTVNLEARIEAASGGSRITVKETVPGLIITIDLKGSLCHILADATKG